MTCRDLPCAITQGETVEEALAAAADSLEEALAGYIDDRRDIPTASTPVNDERKVAVPVCPALKVALYLAVRDAQISTAELARRMRVGETAARRLLDPRTPPELSRIEAALAVLGRHIELSLA